MHEMPDSLALSFQSGSYPQALEFVAFRRSLELTPTDVSVPLRARKRPPRVRMGRATGIRDVRRRRRARG